MNASNLAIMAILALVIGLAIWRCIKKKGKSCCGSGGTVKKVRPEDTNIKNYPYHAAAIVEGMVCMNCVRRVENAFNSMEGYYARVNSEEKRADIYAKVPVTKEFVREIISKAGYTATQIQ